MNILIALFEDLAFRGSPATLRVTRNCCNQGESLMHLHFTLYREYVPKTGLSPLTPESSAIRKLTSGGALIRGFCDRFTQVDFRIRIRTR